MCGIAGKVFLEKGRVSEKELKLMSNAIAHRGPDDYGIYLSEDRKIGLANRRLSIIDLTKLGHQPMTYMNRYTITYNGEVYNFQEERRKLEKSGYKFRSKTDTEVIPALYDKYHIRCLEHLRGMFAFALYDRLANTLFLARDRIGKKPLKYFFDGNVFIFASELKAILTQKEVSKVPDWEAIHHYLTFGYVPAPKTGFKKIFKLEPGHYLFIDIKKKILKKKRYWEPDFSEKLEISEDEWITKILQKLEQSTKLRMIADVSLGAFLSGGVDSSLVVATLALNSDKPINTFTIGFKEQSFDEREYALKFAKIYHTNHKTLLAKPEAVEETLPKIIYFYEEPFADASNLITFLVCKLAKNYVKVVLTGDGGDENFGGYDNRMARLERDVKLEKTLKYLRPIGIPFFNLLSKMTKNKFIQRSYKFLLKSQKPLADRYLSYNLYFENDQKNLLYSKKLLEKYLAFDSSQIARMKFSQAKVLDQRDRALFFDLVSWLPDSQLVKIDIASMSNSLEVRSPFLDQEMIELACKIPFDLKVRDNQFKYILKKAAERLVPKENIYRKKMGFSIPLDRWFKGKLNSYTKSVLFKKNSLALRLFDKDYIDFMLRTHSEKNDFGPELWSLLTLELWFKTYFNSYSF